MKRKSCWCFSLFYQVRLKFETSYSQSATCIWGKHIRCLQLYLPDASLPCMLSRYRKPSFILQTLIIRARHVSSTLSHAKAYPAKQATHSCQDDGEPDPACTLQRGCEGPLRQTKLTTRIWSATCQHKACLRVRSACEGTTVPELQHLSRADGRDYS